MYSLATFTLPTPGGEGGGSGKPPLPPAKKKQEIFLFGGEIGACISIVGLCARTHLVERRAPDDVSTLLKNGNPEVREDKGPEQPKRPPVGIPGVAVVDKPGGLDQLQSEDGRTSCKEDEGETNRAYDITKQLAGGPVLTKSASKTKSIVHSLTPLRRSTGTRFWREITWNYCREGFWGDNL